MHLQRYVLRLILSISCIAIAPSLKATEKEKGFTHPNAKSLEHCWHPYPRIIQFGNTIIPTPSATVPNRSRDSVARPVPYLLAHHINLAFLYINPSCAKALESYPSIGLSLWVPHIGRKTWSVFPTMNIWAASAYIELYRSHPALQHTTHGNSVSIGMIRSTGLTPNQTEPKGAAIGSITHIFQHRIKGPWYFHISGGLLWSCWKNRGDGAETLEHNMLYITSFGIRYIALQAPWFDAIKTAIYYRPIKRNKIDYTVIFGHSNNTQTRTWHPIMRGNAVYNYGISCHDALLFTLEVGYNWQKKALVYQETMSSGMECNLLLGYAVIYGNYTAQIHIGCRCIDTTPPTVSSEPNNKTVNRLKAASRFLADFLERQGFIAIHTNYKLTKRFFAGFAWRPSELPGLHIGYTSIR